MEENKKEKERVIDYRFLARIVIEAATPLAVHSGEKEVHTDAVVIRDVNGFPYIPGSSIAGVIRHAWKDAGNDIDQLFGFQKSPKQVKEEGPDGMGSRIFVSEAKILNSQGQVVDGLKPDEIDKDPLLSQYADLPVRQHVRINHKGVAADNGKYDEQVVFEGTRFCFEMEMIGFKEEADTFKQLLSVLYQSTFRLGGGSRKGFGKIEVVEIKYDELSIRDPYYLKKPTDLEKSKEWFRKTLPTFEKSKGNVLCYKLRPKDFFLFGSGFGDDDADMTPVKEKKVEWKTEDGKLIGALGDYLYLIPSTSIKGALSHRVAFYYNQMTGFFADGKSEKEIKEHTGNKNEAVKLLFGCEGEENGEGKMRGNVIISDMYLDGAIDNIFNHVAIDRFTGGAIDGALFTEKTGYWHQTDESLFPLTLDVLIDKERMERINREVYPKAIEAFNAAIKDLCSGMLPLGGGVNKGHGIFEGKRVDIKL